MPQVVLLESRSVVTCPGVSADFFFSLSDKTVLSFVYQYLFGLYVSRSLGFI